MTETDWEAVARHDYRVPDDRPLAELTAELTTLLGSPDPHLRDEIAFATLATWVDAGIYDELLTGLGDGILTGVAVGLGERDTDRVFRRSFSGLVMATCLARAEVLGLPAETVLRWGDGVCAWWLAERDLRGYVNGAGWAHAIAHGADVLGALAGSSHLTAPELTAILDVIADRIESLDQILVNGEPDRLALATIAVLRREMVPMSVLLPWLNRLQGVATMDFTDPETDPYRSTGNAEAFLRALHVQLILTTEPPHNRSDLQLALVDALRISNSQYLGPTDQ